MTVNIAPSPRQQFIDANGNPYVGAKLFTYLAGTTTKKATYTDSTGNSANTNPIILNSAGRTPSGVWLTDGDAYKFVLAPSTDSDPPVSPIFTEDNITTTSNSGSGTQSNNQWVVTGLTPVYISATSFSLLADQTIEHSPGRRIKATVTAGTIYGTILSSSFSGGSGLTTVTASFDSGSFDSGLSRVDIGLLSVAYPSLPIDVSVPIVGGYIEWTIAAGALTAAVKTLSGSDPSLSSPVYILFKDTTQASQPPVIRTITTALSITAPSGAELGTTSTELSRIRCVAIYTAAGDVALGLYNTWLKAVKQLLPLDETIVYQTYAMLTSSDAGGGIYSAAIHTGRPIVELGYMESTQATAGTWATTPTKQVTVSANYPRSGKFLNSVTHVITSYQTTTTLAVSDNSIPQLTEGGIFINDDYFYKSLGNLAVIEALFHVAHSAATGNYIAHLHLDSAADAVAAGALKGITANVPQQMCLNYQHILASATPLSGNVNYQLVIGQSAAGTLTFNGVSAGNLLNGVLLSTFKITEIFL